MNIDSGTLLALTAAVTTATLVSGIALAMTNCWHTLKTRNEVAANLGLGALTSLVPERR